MRIPTGIVALAAVGSLSTFTAIAQAGPDLDQRLRVVERKLELQAEEAEAKAKDGTTASAGEKGFGFKNADGSFEFRFKGLLQADARVFLSDRPPVRFNDTFLLRRAEPSFELTLGKLAYFKLQPQFAGDTASTADVYGELRFDPGFGVRVGKFKEPLVLENLQSSPAITFVERGLPTELGAGRDLGLQLQGDLFAGTTSYAVGYFNGAPDGRDAAASDTDNRKEAAARLFFEPFRNDYGFFRGLGFGVAGSTGTKLGAANAATFNNTLPRYRSPGQNTIFTYLIGATPSAANTVVAAGDHVRLTPQLYFYRGGFGLLAEQVASQQEVSIGGVTREFKHTAWQGALSYVLTGEEAGFKGIGKPAAPYVPGGEGWGALEIAARYGELDVDDDVFPVYASPTASVTEARTTGGAINWYLTANVKLGLNYDATEFQGGAAGGDRRREQAVFTRLQLSF